MCFLSKVFFLYIMTLEQTVWRCDGVFANLLDFRSDGLVGRSGDPSGLVVQG